MTPRRDRWVDFDRPYAPRRSVEGGVAVPRTWKPSAPEAVRLAVIAEGRTTPGIGSRGRQYARAGQVVEVRVGDRDGGADRADRADRAGGDGGVRASAAVQGSDDAPYVVALTRLEDGEVEATCTCPYGCDDVEWCKHAAALAFVVAHLVETSPDVAAAWSGGADAPADADGPEDVAPARPAADAAELAALVGALRRRPGPVDGAAQWRAAVEVLPLP